MCEWKQELKDLIKKNRQQKQEWSIAIKEALGSASGVQHVDVVEPAFREIKKVFEEEGNHVRIDGRSLIIGWGAKIENKQEYTEEVKYEIKLSDPPMKSQLYIKSFVAGIRQFFPISDEHEIAGKAEGKDIADVTSKDIIDDFIVVYGEYVNKEAR